MRCSWITFPLLGLLAGCAVGPNYHEPAPDAPQAFAAGGGSVQVTAPEHLTRWWESFNDPELTSLTNRALGANLDLQVAVARLQEAEAAYAGSAGAFFPQASAVGAIGRGTGSDLTRGLVPAPLGSADNTDGKTIKQVGGGVAGLQLDLFGQLRRELEASKDDLQAATAARNDVTLAVIAEVARGYFELCGLQMRLDALGHDVAASQDGLKFVQMRYDRGLTNELDLALAQRELATLQAQVAPIRAEIAATRYGLAVMIGQYPEAVDQELQASRTIPSLPPTVAIGVPLDILRRRPDVREAERELAASNARIGVAIGNLYPRLGVAGALGGQGPDAPALTGGHEIWALGATGSWPLVDFGTLDAVVEIADFRHKEYLMNYKHTVLNAIQQVDSAAQLYAAEQSSLNSLSTALTASQRSVTLATQRYDRGLTDYLNVLDAQRQEFDLESQYAATKQTAAEALVVLYRALGGGWEDYKAMPHIETPLPAVVAAFRRVFDSGTNQ